jgi:Ras GTPase-activating-like protein IQGAP2/3
VLAKAYPLYMNIAVHYVRPKQISFVRDAFQGMIREVIEQEDLDLETDPAVVSRFLSAN